MATYDEVAKSAISTVEYLQGLISQGYIIRMQQVEGSIFIFAKHLTDRPDLTAIGRSLEQCVEKMKKDSKSNDKET